MVVLEAAVDVAEVVFSSEGFSLSAAFRASKAASAAAFEKKEEGWQGGWILENNVDT